MQMHVIHSGFFSVDGGAIFGVVPKVLWSKRVPADADNRNGDGLLDLPGRGQLVSMLLRRGRIDQHAVDVGPVGHGQIIDQPGVLKPAGKVCPFVRPEAALVAVEQSLYLPATRNGTPVRGELLVPFTFGTER